MFKSCVLQDSHILIVDDDPIQRMLFKESLHQEFEVILEAVNGKEAIELFNQFHPSIIIMDVEMPIMTGFEACEIIREQEHGKLVSIVITTGLEDELSINKAYEAGATDFIVKPINWTIIRQRIKYMLRSHNLLRELDLKKDQNQAILKAIPDTILSFDTDGKCLEYHRGAVENDILPVTIRGKRISDFLTSDGLETFTDSLKVVLSEKFNRTFEFSQVLNGRSYYFEARIVYKGDEQALAIIRDISSKKEDEQKIWKLAYYDTLTGLPNRQMLRDKLATMLIRAKEASRIVSIVYVDLDRFNQINNTYGHTVGDNLLKLVVERLISCFRRNDCLAYNHSQYKNEIARLGGDEFVLLLSDVDRIENVVVVASRIMKLLAEPFKVGQREIYVTPTIGISNYPNDGDNVEVLLKNANTALHLAKKSGRNNFLIYDEKMNVDKINYLKLENDLRKALDNNELALHFQPQVDSSRPSIVGAEALIRWQHPGFGLIGPDTFIPMAEELGIIYEMGLWVIEESCAQFRRWQQAGVILDTIGVNISAHQFQNHKLVEEIEGVISKYGIDAGVLDLEITEGTIMEDPQQTITALEELKSIGVKLSVDDFGTGYSSLSYLQQFPLDKLKIDRSFVNKLDVNRLDEKIIKVILSLADVLGLSVIAEGVENENQLMILKKYNCHSIQGFYFSKPLDAEEFTKFYHDFGNIDRGQRQGG